ncbi:MAG TPA: alpha/beta hydrolase-fold protein [Spirochaetales bacterium]|nr:alpha/beta hydrolase-fold protein [Spirochaetales bacterium]HRY53540.1 alpha/beta hydrolase-fold protein [Spirochaetia bacterium]HRZ63906.1 alpha/beta hydrolase-fold protein [Spirochaetia bacterium]
MILRGHFFSKALEMETGLSLLAPNAGLGEAPAKVVYLLHGLSGRSGDWLDYTMLPAYAERYGAVFVMPEAARSFYADMAYGQRFFGYVAEELPAVCRALFKLPSGREDTLVMGASMGGYGALKCALSRPESFGACAAFSSACLFLGEGLDLMREQAGSEELRQRFGERLLNDFAAAFGPGLERDPGNELLALAREAAAKGPRPELFLACGSSDAFLEDNRRFKGELEALGFAPDYREWEGAHDWAFFDRAMEQALRRFFGEGTSRASRWSRG